MSEFGPPETLYPAEQTFDPPPGGGEPVPPACPVTYGLLIGHSWLLLRCSRPAHGAPHHQGGKDVPDASWHAAPLADGNFRWPPGARGVPGPRLKK